MTVAIQGVLTVNEIAARTGRSVGAIRELIRGGSVRAMRIGHQWVIAEEDLGAFACEQSWVGRPFSCRTSWAVLSDLEGRRVSGTIHREERSRVRRYRDLPPLTLCRRLRGRSVVRRLSVSSSKISSLREDARWAIGGTSALAHHLARNRTASVVTLYARTSNEEDFLDSSRAVPDDLEPNLLLHLVDDHSWPFDTAADRYVWPRVAFLDGLDQGLPEREMSSLWTNATDNLGENRS